MLLSNGFHFHICSYSSRVAPCAPPFVKLEYGGENRKGVPAEFPKLINRANGLMKPIMVSKEGDTYGVFDQAPSALERTEFVLIWRVLRVHRVLRVEKTPNSLDSLNSQTAKRGINKMKRATRRQRAKRRFLRVRPAT